MQNYNPNTGEYESRLVKGDGTPATKENMPCGDDKKGFKSFKNSKDKKTESLKGLDISDKLREVTDPETGNKFYDLSDDILGTVYEEFGGDEDAMLGYLRQWDFGMSNGDLQGVVEGYGLMKNTSDEPTVYDGIGDYLDKSQNEIVESSETEIKKKGDEGYDRWAKLDKEDRPYLSDYLYSEVFNKDREKTHDYLVSISKNPNRKDKYGNLLASDRAFKAGQRGAREYLEDSLKYDSMDSLRGSNVFLVYMEDAAMKSIMEEGLNEEFDMTYQDYSEILGSVLGEEIDLESRATRSSSGWTRKPYKGYQPK